MMYGLHGSIPSYTRTAVPLCIHGKHSAKTPYPSTIQDAILTLRDIGPLDIRDELDRIKTAVGAHFQTPVNEIMGKMRLKRLCKCRNTYYFLAREFTPASLWTIGKHCGGRDHTTVMNGLRQVKRFWRDYEPAIKVLKGELKP